MYRLIEDIDSQAFIVEFDVNSVKGGVLRHYLNKKKNTKFLELKNSVLKNEKE